jgi:hypothetical protein
LPNEVKAPIEKHLQYIQEQILADSVVINGTAKGSYSTAVKLAGSEIGLALTKC